MALTVADVPGILTEHELRTLICAQADALGASWGIWTHSKHRLLASIARMKEFAELLPENEQTKTAEA
jgi:hypothetical protein